MTMMIASVVVVDDAVVDVAAVAIDDFDFESDREIYQRMTFVYDVCVC